MSSDDHHHHHHHHHKTPKVLEKISHKLAAIKDDITEAVRDRSHSTTSDRRNSISSDHSGSHINVASHTLHNDFSSTSIESKTSFRGHGT